MCVAHPGATVHVPACLGVRCYVFASSSAAPSHGPAVERSTHVISILWAMTAWPLWCAADMPMRMLDHPSQIALVLIDEVHLLNEPERGAALEAGVVSRIRMVARFSQMSEVRLMYPRG